VSRPFAAAVLVAALLVSACGEEELSTEPIEKDIQRGLARQTRVRIDSVKCPDEVKPEAGDTFACTAVYAGGEKARVRVTQRSDDGDVVWRLAVR
jgi:Domain of unknown function (DUF4333)